MKERKGWELGTQDPGLRGCGMRDSGFEERCHHDEVLAPGITLSDAEYGTLFASFLLQA